MEFIKDDFKWDGKAQKPLNVIIVGAGIAGLAAGIGLRKAGHNVTVLERVHEIAEVGAGIQVAPNAARILHRFGILKEVMDKATMMERNSLRRYENDEELGTAPLMPEVGQEYGAPLSVIHRGDLQGILLSAAKANGVNIRTSCRVTSVDKGFAAIAKLSSGEWVEGDVILAADGIKSDIRGQMVQSHGGVDHSLATGDAAYRILIPREKMEHDKEALKLLDADIGMRWMGPKGHIMAYPIKGNKVYNMVLIHPQKSGAPNEESWTSKGDKSEMLDFYSSWSPLVKNLLSYVPEGEVMEWTLNSHRPLPRWVENKVALLGDACHPMLPYVAQGAANAIEDAGVLTIALSLTSNVPLALEVYELVRKERGEKIQQSASTTKRSLHLPDGPEQQARDEAIRNAAKGGKNPDMWADKEWQKFMWGVDVMKETLNGWNELTKKVEVSHVHHVQASTYV